MLNLYGGLSNMMAMDLPRVNSIESAQKYPTVHSMPPNSRVALFDENDDIMYIVSTDASNTIGVKRFRFVEEPLLTPEQIADQKYVTIDQFMNFQTELKEELRNVQQSIQQSYGYQPRNNWNKPKYKSNNRYPKQSSANQEYVVDVEEQSEPTGNVQQYDGSEPLT